MNKKRKIQIILATIIFLINTDTVMCQEKIFLNEETIVSVRYEIRYEENNIVKTIPLSSIGGTIDFNRYNKPDTEIRIWLNVLKLDDKHRIFLQPDVSYQKNYFGLILKKDPQLYIESTGSYYIRYKLSEENLRENLRDDLALKMILLKKKRNRKVDEFSSIGQEYVITNYSSSPLITSLSDLELKSCLDAVISKNKCNYSKAEICGEWSRRNSSTSISTSNLSNQIKSKCIELKHLEDNNTTFSDAYSESDVACQKLTSKYDEYQLHERVDALKEHIDKYPNSDCFNGTIAQKLREAEEDYQSYKEKHSSPLPKKKIKEKQKGIEEIFTWRDKRENRGDFTEITLKAENTNGKNVSAVSDNPTINVSSIGNNEFKLVIPSNEEVDFSVIATINGERISGEQSIFHYSSDIKPLSVEYTPDKEAGDINIKVELRNGKPPYKLGIYANGKLQKFITDFQNNSTIVDENKLNDLRAGTYTMNVLDGSGSISLDNEYEFTKEKGVLDWLRDLILPVLAVVVLGIAYLIFKISKKGNLENISPEDEDIFGKIDNKSSQNTTNISTTVGGTAIATKTKPVINIRKRNNKTIVETGTPLVEIENEKPKIKEVTTSPLLNELLIGKPQEYREIDLLEIWNDSLVDKIYIRDIFAYRIQKFVFEENKALLSSRGESIPEIGGWILGRVQRNPVNDKYIATFERFIQLHKDHKQTTTQLAFGTNAWQDLEKARDIYRDEELDRVGWFHTHPGWGVFLSADDINTHETYFTEPYHIAMELESLKDTHDVGFFTRKEVDGELILNNNAKVYHKWKDFQKWLGK